jgi:TonB family protein
MIGWGIALVGSLWLSPAPVVQASSPGPGSGPTSEGRLFALRSRVAWQRVETRLKELGLSSEKVDRANQVAITNWRDVHTKGMDWLRVPPLPELYVAERVRFEVFVSPFAEPARVYVGSVMEATVVSGGSRARATTYNLAELNRSLMTEIAAVLGGEGLPIPQESERRRQLALSALGDDADDCLRQSSHPKGGKITSPRKVAVSEFEVLYPAGALGQRKEGTVKVMFSVHEDGGVTGVRLVDPPLGDPFEASAMGATSLLIYSPSRLDGCPVPSVMTYTVRYRP